MRLRVDASGSGPTVASARLCPTVDCERNTTEMRLGPEALAAGLGLAAGTQRCRIPLSGRNMQVNQKHEERQVVGLFGGL